MGRHHTLEGRLVVSLATLGSLRQQICPSSVGGGGLDDNTTVKSSGLLSWRRPYCHPKETMGSVDKEAHVTETIKYASRMFSTSVQNTSIVLSVSVFIA